MKTLFTITSLVSAIITGLVSFRLFERAHYNVSALLTISSFLTAALLVSVLSSKKIKFQ
ncbi:MAG: hypothetical protein JST58_01865 [Bacteroidetes bacterium]|nr:hypothetical protein [Bacteroidota bacterium]